MPTKAHQSWPRLMVATQRTAKIVERTVRATRQTEPSTILVIWKLSVSNALNACCSSNQQQVVLY